MGDDVRSVGTYPTPMEARRVVDLLEEEGIAAFVADEAMATWDWAIAPALGGCRVFVAEEELDRARAVVEAADARSSHPDVGGGEAAGPVDDGTSGPEDETDEEVREAERWTQATLMWAFVGLVFWPVLLGMPFRLAAAPDAVARSAAAHSRLIVARLVVYLALGAGLLVAWRLLAR
jgi:hypothetical protein